MLEKLKAEEIMMTVPAELSLEDPAHRIKDLMDESDACHLPVTVNSEILGMISRDEAGAAKIFGPGNLAALDFMKTDFIKVDPKTSLREMTNALVTLKNDCLAVVSGRDEFLGIVRVHDILRRFVHYQQAEGGSFRFSLVA